MAEFSTEAYNIIIAEYNKSDSKVEPAEQVKTLKDQYDLLTKIADSEEIITLLNLCIAEDRLDSQSRVELYNHYLRLREMVWLHGPYGINDYESVIYDLGILSFKFHDYDIAIDFFQKAEPLLLERQKALPTLPNRQDYISCLILHAYSLEYKSIGAGAFNAINYILGINDEKTFNDILPSINFDQESNDVINEFFCKFNSEIYKLAQEVDEETFRVHNDSSREHAWKNEVIHVMAHCLSEYSVFLKKERKRYARSGGIHSIFNKYSDLSHELEILSEKFIDSLDENMLTCKAIIYSEHGLYWSAISKMVIEYDSLSEKLAQGVDEKETRDLVKKKAELAFYIYYFNNRVSTLAENKANECKKFFLDYANESGNEETKFYADIIDFREKLANTIANNYSTEDRAEKLDNLFKGSQDLDDIFKQTYIHPQIKEEKEKLLLAYNILLTYYQQVSNIGNDRVDEMESFLEKCFLFNNNGSNEKAKNDKRIDIAYDKAYSVEIQGVVLHFMGLSKEWIDLIEKDFCTKCIIDSIDPYDTNAIFLCDTDEKVENAVAEFKKAGSGSSTNDYRVYFPQVKGKASKCNISDLLANKVEAKDKSEFLKIIYVQRTLENCFLRAKRWDEYFISAPITDNDTFAFQSKNIESYIKIRKEVTSDEILEQKKLFEKYAKSIYESSKVESDPISEIAIDLPEYIKDKFKRLYYYTNGCFYEYKAEKRAFLPQKLFDDTTALKNAIRINFQPNKRNDARMQKCHCINKRGDRKYRGRNCCCHGREWEIRDDKIFQLMKEAHFPTLSDEEKAYVLVLSDRVDDYEPLCSFLLVIEDKLFYHAGFVETLGILDNKYESLVQATSINNGDDSKENKVESPPKQAYSNLTQEVIEHMISSLTSMSQRCAALSKRNEEELTGDFQNSIESLLNSKYHLQIAREYTMGRAKKEIGELDLYFFINEDGIKQEKYILENKVIENFSDQYMQLMGYLNPNFSAGITLSINTSKRWEEAYDFICGKLEVMKKDGGKFAPISINRIKGDKGTRYIKTEHIVPETELTMPVYHLVLQLSDDDRLEAARKARK